MSALPCCRYKFQFRRAPHSVLGPARINSEWNTNGFGRHFVFLAPTEGADNVTSRSVTCGDDIDLPSVMTRALSHPRQARQRRRLVQTISVLQGDACCILTLLYDHNDTSLDTVTPDLTLNSIRYNL